MAELASGPEDTTQQLQFATGQCNDMLQCPSFPAAASLESKPSQARGEQAYANIRGPMRMEDAAASPERMPSQACGEQPHANICSPVRLEGGPEGWPSQLQTFQAPSRDDLLSELGQPARSHVGHAQPCSTAAHSRQLDLPEAEEGPLLGAKLPKLDALDLTVSAGHDEGHQIGGAQAPLQRQFSHSQAAAASPTHIGDLPLLHKLPAWRQSHQDLINQLRALPGKHPNDVASLSHASAPADDSQPVEVSIPLNLAAPAPQCIAAQGSNSTADGAAGALRSPELWRTAAESFGGPPLLLELAAWLHSHSSPSMQTQILRNCSRVQPPADAEAAAGADRSSKVFASDSAESLQQGKLLQQASHAATVPSSKAVPKVLQHQDWQWLISDLCLTQQLLLAWARMRAMHVCPTDAPGQHAGAALEAQGPYSFDTQTLTECKEWVACQMNLAALHLPPLCP